jgi:hypothetical protein
MNATVVSTRFDTRPWVSAGAAGLIAGLVFAMWAMAVGIFTTTLWAAPQGIAQSIGIGQAGHDFQLVPLIVGLMGHMMNSIVIGLVFFGIVEVLRLRGGLLVIAGMVYGIVVYVVMYDLVLRGFLSGTSGSFLSANPEWSWVLGHLMYGLVLGLLLAFSPLRPRLEAR